MSFRLYRRSKAGRRFRNTLLAQSYAVRSAGGHDDACWNKTLVDELKWRVPLRPRDKIREPIYSRSEAAPKEIDASGHEELISWSLRFRSKAQRSQIARQGLPSDSSWTHESCQMTTERSAHTRRHYRPVVEGCSGPRSTITGLTRSMSRSEGLGNRWHWDGFF